MQILLVEDDDICRDIVEATLSKHGNSVTSVATGAEAVALLDSGLEPDLLLTDIQLPGDCDGWLLARLFQDQLPELPVVYITATHRGAHQVSNSIYLLKPLRPGLLLQAIDAIAPERRDRCPAWLH